MEMLLEEQKVKHPDLPISKTNELWAQYFDISLEEWYQRWEDYRTGKVKLHQVFVQRPEVFLPKVDYNTLVENPITGEKKSYYHWSTILKIKVNVVAKRIARMNRGELSPELCFTPYRCRISAKTLAKYKNPQPVSGLPAKYVQGKGKSQVLQNPYTKEWNTKEAWAAKIGLPIGAFLNRIFLCKKGCVPYTDVFKERRAGCRDKFYPDFVSSAQISDVLKKKVKDKIAEMNEGKARIDHWTISSFMREAISAIPSDFVIELPPFEGTKNEIVSVQLKQEFAQKMKRIASENDSSMSAVVNAALRWGIQNF
ncbi:MAG: hypothetical protein PUP93_16185 [Rhizonema sp. NSF051]|nr:hypothetical protein [Rhizonema sp. NSF051]